MLKIIVDLFKRIVMIIIFCCFCSIIFAQINKDKIIFEDYKSGYYENYILKDNIKNESDSIKPITKYLSCDIQNNKFPNDTALYKLIWHNKPLSQGMTGTCWCFSTTSFLESEVKRITGVEVKFSEMYIVYWEYVERAIDFVKTRGETSFTEGSEANAVTKICKKYGIVPFEVYKGKTSDAIFYNHSQMFDEMNEYLKKVKQNNRWNEDLVAKSIKNILNNYIGVPPEKFNYKNAAYTPIQFLNDYLKLKVNDYYSFMSTKEFKYNEKHELIEADNWWHDDNYYNISLDEYFDLIVKSIENKFSISICGDVSEVANFRDLGVAVIPDFDIPSEFINEDSRQFRLSNSTTTDDHCIHLIGCKKIDDKYWFVVKDSGSSSFDSPIQGYRFFSEDYIKLKMMNILVHKDAAKGILNKIIK
ncbi:MAG: hypothetical protein A2046_16160 [Bacteroidetes bacterium GWA2_30_7]|nr:MAG: hypothetical protein A2046_16160 [Bacteroidetes bacterium GWA2_30_7]